MTSVALRNLASFRLLCVTLCVLFNWNEQSYGDIDQSWLLGNVRHIASCRRRWWVLLVTTLTNLVGSSSQEFFVIFWFGVVVGKNSWTGVCTQYPRNSSGTCCRIWCGTVSHPFQGQMLVCTFTIVFSVTCWSCELQKCKAICLHCQLMNQIQYTDLAKQIKVKLAYGWTDSDFAWAVNAANISFMLALLPVNKLCLGSIWITK